MASLGGGSFPIATFRLVLHDGTKGGLGLSKEMIRSHRMHALFRERARPTDGSVCSASSFQVAEVRRDSFLWFGPGSRDVPPFVVPLLCPLLMAACGC